MRLVTAIVLLTATGIAARAQQPIRSSTDLVAVYATVMDKTGRLVPDLTKDAFEVRDEGRPQPITAFSNAVQPITIVIMLDRSGSMMTHSEIVEHAAATFVDRLLPSDRARIGDLSKRILIHPASFTGDKDALKRILRTELQDDLNGPSPVWTAVARAIDAVRAEEGRKVVLIFSDGHDEPDEFQPKTKFSDVLEEAARSGVMVYSVAVPATVPSGYGYAFGRSFGGGTKTEPPDKHLRELSNATGGGYMAFDWAQNLNETFARVADELHHQYLIGFVPRVLDGRSHSIALRVRQNDLVVRGRTSYIATGASRGPQL